MGVPPIAKTESPREMWRYGKRPLRVAAWKALNNRVNTLFTLPGVYLA
jgi:hypothetical protein